MKVALVYDRVNSFGGAERVLEELHRIWPNAPLYTSIYDKSSASWAIDWDIRTSFLQNIPFIKRHHHLLGWAMPFAFESFDLGDFDLIVSVTSEFAKALISTTNQLHICYLLTPTRYLWSHAAIYERNIPKIVRPFACFVLSKLRIGDFVASQRPDVMISVSKLVQRRCQKYYRRTSQILYPPENLMVKEKHSKHRTFWITVSRLVKYKKIDLVIQACNQLQQDLVVVGVGREEKSLKKIAGSTIHFVGYLTDQELVRYYQKAKALIMPQEEDLGIAALEAQHCGTPVITLEKSGAAELIIENKTGEFIKEQTVAALIEVLNNWDQEKYNPNTCRAHAVQYSTQRFRKQLKKLVRTAWKNKNQCQK